MAGFLGLDLTASWPGIGYTANTQDSEFLPLGPLLHLYPVKHYFVGLSSHFHPCFVPDFVILCIYKPSQFSDISENGTLILLCRHGDSLRLETLAAIRDPFVAPIKLLLNNLGEYHPLIMNPPRWIASALQCRVPRTMLFSLSKLLILSVP